MLFRSSRTSCNGKGSIPRARKRKRDLAARHGAILSRRCHIPDKPRPIPTPFPAKKCQPPQQRPSKILGQRVAFFSDDGAARWRNFDLFFSRLPGINQASKRSLGSSCESCCWPPVSSSALFISPKLTSLSNGTSIVFHQTQALRQERPHHRSEAGPLP